jgi:hypothetical protein
MGPSDRPRAARARLSENPKAGSQLRRIIIAAKRPRRITARAETTRRASIYMPRAQTRLL